MAVLFYLSIFKYINWKIAFSIGYLILSILYLILTPCNAGFDENGHFLRSYEISKGHMTSGHLVDGAGCTDGISELNDALSQVLSGISVNEAEDVYAKQKKYMDRRIDMDELGNYYNVNQCLYSPVSYIPHVIGLFIGNYITDNALVYYYMGRTSGLLINALFVILAVWLIPDRKGIVALVASTPIFISQICTYSADGTINSFSLFFIAYILYLRNKGKMSAFDMVITAMGSGVVALSKVIYFPLVFLVFLVPGNSFKNKKTEIVFKVTTCVFAFTLFLVWFLIAKTYLFNFYGRNVYPDKQLAYLLRHIYYFPIIIIKTIIAENFNWLHGLFGGVILSNNVIFISYMFEVFMFITIIELLCLEDTSKEEVYKYSFKQKIIIWLTILLILGLTFSSLYVQWTPYMSETILGIQGRYFIPLILPFSLVLKRFRIIRNYEARLGLEWIVVMILNMYALAFEYYVFS